MRLSVSHNTTNLPTATADAAVILAPFSAMSDPLKCCQEALRTLKPGSPLIVLQRQIGGSALQGVLGGCEGATTSQLDRLSELEGIAKISWDVAGKGLDPHAVGVITRGAMTADKAAEKKDSIESRVRSGGKQEQRDGKGF